MTGVCVDFLGAVTAWLTRRRGNRVLNASTLVNRYLAALAEVEAAWNALDRKEVPVMQKEK